MMEGRGIKDGKLKIFVGVRGEDGEGFWVEKDQRLGFIFIFLFN